MYFINKKDISFYFGTLVLFYLSEKVSHQLIMFSPIKLYVAESLIKGYEITRVIRMSCFTFTPFMSLRFNFPRIRQVDAIHPSMINLSTMKRGENFQMASKLEQC